MYNVQPVHHKLQFVSQKKRCNLLHFYKCLQQKIAIKTNFFFGINIALNKHCAQYNTKLGRVSII